MRSKLEVKYKKNYREHTNSWKVNNTLMNMSQKNINLTGKIQSTSKDTEKLPESILVKNLLKIMICK